MAIQQVANAQQLRGLGHVHAALGLGDTLEAELQVGQHRQVGKQAGLLEYITEGTFVRRYKHPVTAVLPDLLVDLHKPITGPLQPGNAAQAGGLARAGVPVECGDAPPRQLQVHVQGKPGILQLQAHFDHRHQLQPALVLRLE